MKTTRTIYFCTICNTQLEVCNWGSRAECPECNKIVPTKSVEVPILKKEK